MNRGQILDTAKELVFGARAKEYGPPIANFACIAIMWKEILGINITPAQVAMCMIAIKLTRLMQTEKHDDSWIDIAGYAACGGEVTDAVHATK